MALRLSIVSGDVADSGNRRRWTFGVNGGRIGRAPDNDWVLVDPDRFLSSHHAEIEHRTGEWWISDTSTNGTFINDSTQPLGRGGRHRISNGDRIRVGSLQLQAEISGGNDFLPDEDFDLAETALDNSFAVRSLLSNESSSGGLRAADAYGQPLPGKGGRPTLPEDRPRRAATAPGVVAPQSRPAAKPAREAPVPGSPERDIWPGLVAFCQGAGIDPLSLPDAQRNDLLREAGQAMREMMLGLMELARARAEFSREIGLSGSGRLRDATSPLMQIRGVEAALAELLTGTAAGGGRPVDEVRTQFAKTRHHQQSMFVALREALTATLGALDPEELAQQFGGASRGPGSTETQARYWGLYREAFRSLLAAQGESGLPAVFQEEFARAYQALSSVGLRTTGKIGESN
jgi:predicted component of type VI protein secretion system